ncbi:16S rRNA (cytosine(967)-C(5))-methyltransferase [Gammaproteobacteria bacterium 42_54_T18]|nr:16S rRNA (cytosine(967)-C(5))-methyltransferase [Gammaproteobacteria bacterium 42_54_T18]
MLNDVLPLKKGQVHNGRSLSALLPKTLTKYPDADRPLLQELCFGVCRWFIRLDKIASLVTHHPFKTRDSDIHALLLVGIYQILYLRVPDHAAISETVEATRQMDKAWAAKVINGTLRRLQREKNELEQSLPDNLTVQSAHPKWLVDMIKAAWPEQAERIVSNNNTQAPMTIRVNPRHNQRESYLQQLKQKGIQAKLCEFSTCGIQLEKACSVEKLPGFDQGHCFVQDEAAQLSAKLLDAQPGDRVLDACAAPGGKTTHIAELQPDLTALVALDADEQRVTRIHENLQRLALTAEVHAQSLESFTQQYLEQPTDKTAEDNIDNKNDIPLFNRILLDAPCSAVGVIRRHPDIKWLRKRTDINALAETQLLLLKNAWTLLAPGGTLLYATCSILPHENERVVHTFLAEQNDAKEQVLDVTWGQAVSVGVQLLPQKDGHDGFYYAKLLKAEN